MITTLINQNLIKLSLSANSKEDVFKELIDVLYAQGRISDKVQFLADIKAREELKATLKNQKLLALNCAMTY